MSDLFITPFGVVRHNPRHRPRIELVNGFWLCHRGTTFGVGDTRETAYSDWLRRDLDLPPKVEVRTD